jgi:hypothetical protein
LLGVALILAVKNAIFVVGAAHAPGQVIGLEPGQNAGLAPPQAGVGKA